MIQRQLTVEQMCNSLRPIFGKKVDDMYLRYAMADSREEKEGIVHVLSALYHKNVNELLSDSILLEPPKKGVVDAPYRLGAITYSGKHVGDFGLREKDWARHVCVTGMSGSGKTMFAYNILEQLIKEGKNFLVFDWKKSFRPLLKASSDIVMFTVGNEGVSNSFKMNINKPPKGVDPREWINVLCDLLTESFSASYGVHKVLLETLDEAYTHFGVYEGSENYPTWDQIKWYLQEKFDKTKGRESGWIESAMRISSVLTFGNFGKVVSYKGQESVGVEDILDKRIILELNALSNVEKKFFSEFILTYVYKLKKANQKSCEGTFDHAILVDEAHNIFLKSPTHFAKESVTDMIYREMREYGTSLICLDQHVSKLSDTVKGNSACHVVFQQQLPQDIMDVSSLMQLRDKQHYFSRLPVGSAIVKLSERYTAPFLIDVSYSKLRDVEVTDADVRMRAQNLIAQLSVERNVDPDFNRGLLAESVKKEAQIRVEHDKAYVTAVKEPAEFEVVLPSREHDDYVIEYSEGARDSAQSSHGLTEAQALLYAYVGKKLNEGKRLRDIEAELGLYCEEGNYTLYDVGVVVNKALEAALEPVRALAEDQAPYSTTNKGRKIYKENSPVWGSDADEKEQFLSFLRSAVGQDYGTVALYKKLGLSSRKGNKIKDELLSDGLIKVVTEKSDSGWKKVICLA